MTKQQAIYLAYICAEGLNDPNTRKRCRMFYGEHGVKNASEAVKAIASEYSFEPPILVVTP